MRIPSVVWKFLGWLLFCFVVLWPIMYVVTWLFGSILPSDFDDLMILFRSPATIAIFAFVFALIYTLTLKQTEQENRESKE